MNIKLFLMVLCVTTWALCAPPGLAYDIENVPKSDRELLSFSQQARLAALQSKAYTHRVLGKLPFDGDEMEEEAARIQEWLTEAKVRQWKKWGLFDVFVIGGEPVPDDEFNFTVALQVVDLEASTNQQTVWLQYCAGTVISENFVLTAAHCDWPDRTIRVVAGSKDLRDDHVHVLPVKNFHRHERFIGQRHQEDGRLLRAIYDIGLVELDEPLSLGDKVDLADQRGSGQGIVAGWGIYHEPTQSKSQVLRKTSVTIFEDDECEDILGKTFLVETMLCGKSTENNNAAQCRGDSGGPLVTNGDDTKQLPKPVQIGIVSYGPTFCAGKQQDPGIYTNVAAFGKWISDIISGHTK